MPAASYVFYNLGPAGDRANQRDAAEREVRALLADKPAVLGLSEAIGYSLPIISGYRRIRDTSRPGRANVAAYVRADLALSKVRWRDCHKTWPRTEHPGEHPARSWLEFDLGGTQVLVGHQPPDLRRAFPANGRFLTSVIQQEGFMLLRRRMAPWLRTSFPLWLPSAKKAARARPRLVMADFNRRPGEDGWGPSQLAGAIGGCVVGARIDCAVARRMSVVSADYRPRFNGVRLGSDHVDAFVFTAVPRQ